MPGVESKIRATAGFTLIELLIVVAIIGILAAIAIPNFLAAQTRARVSAVQSDMRTLALAAEMYAVDNNQFPPHREQQTCTELPYYIRYSFFTSPVPYMSGIPGREVFVGKSAVNDPQQDAIADTLYLTYTNFWSFECRLPNAHALWPFREDHTYLIRSRGPDTTLEGDPVRNAHFIGLGNLSPDPFVYDPTNGVVSRGEIFRTRREFN